MKIKGGNNTSKEKLNEKNVGPIIIISDKIDFKAKISYQQRRPSNWKEAVENLMIGTYESNIII